LNAEKYLKQKFQIEILLENNKTKYNNWLNGEKSKSISIFKTKTTTELNTISRELVTSKNEIVGKYAGLNKFLFDLTQKRKYAVKLLSAFESLLPDLKEMAINKGIAPSIEKSKNGSSIIQQYENLILFIEDGIQNLNKISEFEKSISMAEENLINTENEIQQTKSSEKELLNKIDKLKIQNEGLGIPLLNELIHSKLSNTNEAQINKYKDYIPDSIPWRSQEIPEFIETTSDFLATFNMTAITSLSIKSAFPLSDELFDIVVIDEASQCDIASALPLVLRAKQLVVIGDPMQLKHISKVQSYEEKYIVSKLNIDTNLRLDYVNESLYDYCYNLSITSKSQSVFLKEHFRCHPQIIGYSNKAFYGPKMGQELEIATTNEQYKIDPKGIYWLNVNGSHHQTRNINKKEQEKVIDVALKLADKNKEATIGITTPFNHQAKDLNESIPNAYRNRIKADTVHRFQGDEKDIMILSLVLSSDSPKYKAEWINNKVPFLINVAVTRAKNSLYIIGNAKYCRTLPNNSPLGQLVKYVDDINPIQM
jgi:superfamily I DNA and/or RNA helicase